MKRFRYFLEYLVLMFFFWVVSLLGIDKASALGGFLGRSVGPFLGASRVAFRNISFVYPQLSEHEKKEMIKKMWDNLGRSITELPYIHTMSDEEFYSRVDVKRDSDKKKSPNESAILVSGHFANWEVGARTLVPYSEKISIVYRDNNNPLINDRYLAMRNNRFSNIAKGQAGAKDIMRAVRDKHLVCFLQDQKLNQGVEVKLFNKPAMTTKAPMSLALKFGLPIMFVHAVRLKGAYFESYLDGPYELKDLVHDIDSYKTMEEKEVVLVQKMNDIIESWVHAHPEQWFWVHRRWEKSFYQN